MSDSKNETRFKLYDQLCNSYRAIDDFRAKLLGFLPLATGGGIFFLINTLKDETRLFLFPIGIFGFIITLGLFCYELYGIKKCHHLILEGKKIETELGLTGQFVTRPREVIGLINEPFAAGIIYPAVLAAWIYGAVMFKWPQTAQSLAIVVFVLGFVGAVAFNFLLGKGDKIIASIPPDYHTSLKLQQCSRFNVNAIKSFVYHVFALYDRHPDVSQFLPLLADPGLEMRGLDEKKTIRSHQDFRNWYQEVGDSIESNLHQVERLEVKLLANGKYEVALVVLWQAVMKDQQFISQRFHQVWSLDDGSQSEWPRICSYIVRSL